MKKLKLTTLVLITITLLVGCAAKEEEVVIEENVIDYTNTTVFELLELSDKIKFIGKSEGADILVDADDIFTRLSMNDSTMLFGKDKVINNDNLIRFFFSSLLEWDKEFLTISEELVDDRTEYEKAEEDKLNQLIGGDIAEKDRVISIVLEIEDYFTENNISMPSEIKIAKYSDLFEFEEAFNVANTIFLSEKLLLSHKETIKDELIRQLFFVYLNNNPDDEERLFSKMGFSKSSELIVDENIIANKYTNPNAPKLNYAFNGQYGDQNIMFIPVSNIKKSEDGNFTMVSKYYSVDISQEESNFIMYDKSNVRDEKGTPIALDLSEIKNFGIYFLNKSGDFKHPRIIASDYFIDMVDGRTPREPKIVEYFVEILGN